MFAYKVHKDIRLEICHEKYLKNQNRLPLFFKRSAMGIIVHLGKELKQRDVLKMCFADFFFFLPTVISITL